MYIKDNKYIRKDTNMAVRYSNHKIYEKDLDDFKPEVLLASGKTWDGFWKRLFVRCIFTPELKTFILLQHEGKDDTEFSSIVDAIEAYNEM